MDKRTRYSAEVRERTVRLVQEHRPEYGSQWAGIESIAAKVGCTAETFLRWVRQDERGGANGRLYQRADLDQLLEDAVTRGAQPPGP